MTGSIREAILGSVTNRSLSLEARVATAFRERGWITSHSAYFRDPATGKDREIDVVAQRVVNRQRDPLHQTIRLSILAECKTAEEGSLLFVPLPPNGGQRLYSHWLDPDHHPTRARLFDVLTTAGLEKVDATEALEQFLAAVYPEGESMFGDLLTREALPPVNRASSGHSVWKDRNPLNDGTQALYSTIEGTSAELLSSSADEVRDRVAVTGGGTPGLAEAIDVMSSEATSLQLFHPVVVTDIPLWLRQHDGDVVEITSCRVEQSRIATAAIRWVDVVHESHLIEWAEALTRWYEEKLHTAPE
jgi:hypothetical protein